MRTGFLILVLLNKRECFHLGPEGAPVENRASRSGRDRRFRGRDHRAASENYLREVCLGAGVSSAFQEEDGLSVN